jgi:hypothetical protein
MTPDNGRGPRHAALLIVEQILAATPGSATTARSGTAIIAFPCKRRLQQKSCAHCRFYKIDTDGFGFLEKFLINDELHPLFGEYFIATQWPIQGHAQ